MIRKLYAIHIVDDCFVSANPPSRADGLVCSAPLVFRQRPDAQIYLRRRREAGIAEATEQVIRVSFATGEE
jgi:hypothetical protein